jgi:hypothetical protein
MDSDIEITGRYVNSMVESTGKVSPVFRRKMEELLEEYGISDPDPEAWYNAASFAEAVDRVADEIGNKTVSEAGKQMGEDVPKPPDVESPHDVLEQMHDQHYKSYRNVERGSIGGYTYERIDDTTVRLGVTEGFPYPMGIARGATIGIAADITGNTVSTESVPTKPTGPDKSPEMEAYELSW